MSDIIEDLIITGGVLWMFSILIKGLLYALFGIYIVLFVVYRVFREFYPVCEEDKNGPETL